MTAQASPAQRRAGGLVGALPRAALGAQEASLARLLGLGALIWGAYSALYVLLRGSFLDEVVMPAQIITGAIGYPAGHPHQVFYTQAYSLQNYLAAGFLALVPDPWLISAIRNVAFLFLSLFVPFGATVLLTRSLLWGHVAAVLTMTETGIRFQGVYPLWIFPGMYSQGHFGLHVALLVVSLLIAGRWLTGGLLLGLLPGVHPALAAIVWPWSGLYFAFERARLEGASRRQLAVAAGAGLTVCAGLAAVVFSQGASATVAPPYDAGLDGERVRQSFIALTDVHRSQHFPFPSPAYLLNPLAFFVLGAVLMWNAARQPAEQWARQALPALRWLLLVGLVVWLVIWGARLLPGANLPGTALLVELLMPWRFSNITALLLIPLGVAVLASALRRLPGPGRALGVALAIGLVLVGAAATLMNRDTGFRYSAVLLFGLAIGAQLAVAGPVSRRVGGLGAGLALVAGALWLVGWSKEAVAFLSSSATTWLVLGLSGAWASHLRVVGHGLTRTTRPGLLAACGVAGMIALGAHSVWDNANAVYDAAGQRAGRWDEVTTDDRGLATWLAANTGPNELVLTAIMPRSELQPKVNRPVLMELETLWLMTYMPRVAPAVGLLTRDLYGIDYADEQQVRQIAPAGRLSLESPVWLAAWRARSHQEWQELGGKYGFRLVLAPTATPLDLPAAFPGRLWTLYVIS